MCFGGDNFKHVIVAAIMLNNHDNCTGLMQSYGANVFVDPKFRPNVKQGVIAHKLELFKGFEETRTKS